MILLFGIRSKWAPDWYDGGEESPREPVFSPSPAAIFHHDQRELKRKNPPLNCIKRFIASL